jgi:hypothetical protein
MTDPILKKAMDKRDEALREVERWEKGSKTTWNLSELTLESLDSPKGRAKVEVQRRTVSSLPPRFAIRHFRLRLATAKQPGRAMLTACE